MSATPSPTPNFFVGGGLFCDWLGQYIFNNIPGLKHITDDDDDI